MHDPFFFTDSFPDGPLASPLVLRGVDAHHLTVVRRAKAGDEVRISDGAGTVVRGRVSVVGQGSVEVVPLSVQQVPRPAPAVRVFQGLAKGAKVDLVVQKLVELGVDEVVVFTSGRSVPRWDGRKHEQMATRWATIAREAAKQSRRPWLPKVSGPVGAAAAVSMSGDGRALLADDPEAPPLRMVLPSGAIAGRVSVVIGPEGGLTPAERGAFVAAGAAPFSLGPQILRTETASLASAALVLHRVGRLG